MSLVSTRPARTGTRADLLAAGLALALVVVVGAIGVAFDLTLFGEPHFPGAPTTFGEWPVLGEWHPHLGPGTPLAILVAVAAIAWAPSLAHRLPWRAALTAGYLLCVAWTFALALVDGWTRGVATQLASSDEYLGAVPGITDIPAMLRTFSDRILDWQPDSWVTHVAGHPPGATLTFVWLDRIGLSGGTWAAVVCVLVSGAVAVAVPVTISALGAHEMARAALPFVAFLPGAVWLGVSADALFAGVTATGVALLAIGAAGSRFGVAACLAGGVLLGFGIFLSYGLILMGLIALAVVWVTRSWRALALAATGALAVVGAFALAGFWWLDGYHLVVERYYQGIANARPYPFWIVADLACLVLAIGPAAVAGLRRAMVAAGPVLALTRPAGPRRAGPVLALVWAAGLAVLAATVSGLSKAEVERIWLPFAVWLVAAAALLPATTRRSWLAAGAVTALLVNHVLLTNW